MFLKTKKRRSSCFYLAANPNRDSVMGLLDGTGWHGGGDQEAQRPSTPLVTAAVSSAPSPGLSSPLWTLQAPGWVLPEA